MNNFIQKIQNGFAQDFSAMMLRIFIVTWALIVVIAAFTVKSKWVLAGILAWELLP